MSLSKITHLNSLGNTLGASMNILYFNARSVRNKFEEIQQYLDSSKRVFHIIIITETWLNKNETHLHYLRGYQAFHSTRDDINILRGGGVSIYVLDSFDRANEIGNKYWNGNNCLAIELLKEKVKIIGFYRQPNNRLDPDGSKFVIDLNVFLNQTKGAYIFGDFNLNLYESSKVVESYRDAIMLNDFVVLNSRSSNFPTRINYRTGTSSCIDHVYTDQFEEDDIKRATLSYFDLIADHKALCLSVWKNYNETQQLNTIRYNIINHKRIRDEKLFEQLNCDNFNSLAMACKDIIDNNTIEITKTNQNRKPFMNNNILKYIKIKRNYEKLKRKYPLSEYVQNKWKVYRNKVSSLCIRAKKKHLDEFFSRNANDARKVWGKINCILNKKPKKSENDSVSVLIEDNSLITDKKLIANAINNHYINISKKIYPSHRVSRNNALSFHRSEIVDIKHKFECPKCTEDETKTIIDELKNSNSRDVFGMSNNFVKIHRDSLVPILTKLINLHMLEGSFPDALKFSIIKPIYKGKGSKTEKTSYRPVSLISIFSKIFEKVIYRRLIEHCHQNEYFHPDQFGYQKRSNPEAAMLHTLHDIYSAINKKFLTSLLTIDLTSAFDCIDHEILLVKLSKLKLPPFFMMLLKTYLLDRSQAVKVDDTISEILSVVCGSPQGGVLSGLLFNIYVNSIFKLALDGKLRLYCDDMSLISQGVDKTELSSSLQKDLSLIDNWLDFHYLKANYSKTKYVLFSGRKKFESFTEANLGIKIGSFEIKREECVKLVGLHIDECLNFSIHIDHIKNKIIPFVAKLIKIRRFISERTALNLYFAHVYSHLIFMNSIWSVAPKYLTESLGVIQRRALRAVYLKNRLSSSKELYSEKVLPLSEIFEYHQNLIMFKIMNNMLKNHIYLQTVDEVHSHNTRASIRNDLSLNKNFHESDFYFRASRTFNRLSEGVKKFHSLNLFKKRLKEFLFESYMKNR